VARQKGGRDKEGTRKGQRRDEEGRGTGEREERILLPIKYTTIAKSAAETPEMVPITTALPMLSFFGSVTFVGAGSGFGLGIGCGVGYGIGSGSGSGSGVEFEAQGRKMGK
jgi:hypothetical protein